MNQSENINELISAMAKAQGEIGPALKDSINPHFKSRYADLNSVWNACRSALSKNGLAVIQTTCSRDNSLFLETMLAHSSGQWIRAQLPVVTHKNDAQGIGTALTYMRRYGLAAIVGVAPDEDDDGETAVGRGKFNQKAESRPVLGKDDLDRLTTVLIDCGPKYKDSVREHLKSEYAISSFDQLTPELYAKIFKAATDKRKEMQEAQKEFVRKSEQGAAANG